MVILLLKWYLVQSFCPIFYTPSSHSQFYAKHLDFEKIEIFNLKQLRNLIFLYRTYSKVMFWRCKN